MKTEGVTREEFMKALSNRKRCYIKKPKSWQKIWMWWEPDKNDPNEKWFMNIARASKNEIEESVWIIAKNIDHWIGYMEREGYKYYVNE